MDPVICKKCGGVKVAMRNARNAPMLGCPTCYQGSAKNLSPTPVAPPQPPPTPAKPKRGWGTLLHAGQ